MNYIYGINSVAEALKARGRAFAWVGVAKERHDLRLQRVVDECRRQGVAVRFVDRAELDRMAGNNAHQGVVAVTSAKHYNDLDDVVAAKRGANSLIVVLDGVEDPHNLGAILRTADAAGADGVVFSAASVDPYNSKCVRSSAGSLFHLPVVAGPPLTDVISGLRAAGLQVLAADGRASHVLDDPASGPDLTLPTAWLFGNEAWGLPDGLRALADAVVAVPIYGRAESLNLAAAAAVCLYASARQARVRP